MQTYSLDAFSHYLNGQPLHPRQHLQLYKRGHCLDLAMALFDALTCEGISNQILGQIKPEWGIPIHYAVLTTVDSVPYWLDPNMGICTPLIAGAEFSLGTKRNVISAVKPCRFEITIEGTRRIIIQYKPIKESDLIYHQQTIWHTRKDLSLRYGNERGNEQIRYYWQTHSFTWNDQAIELEQLSNRDKNHLANHFGFDVADLLHSFVAAYSRIPITSFWQWQP
jgi:hypothetical protein